MVRTAQAEDIEQFRWGRIEEPLACHGQAKSNILVKLKRLLPGCTDSVAALRREDGQVANSAAEMAEALRTHWERVFQAPMVDADLMRQWLDALPPSPSAAHSEHRAQDPGAHTGDTLARPRPPRRALPREAWKWKVRRKDVQTAVQRSGGTAPGPDGIPLAA